MTVCANCGHENPERSRFCNACAAPLTPQTETREQRKTVTVLFCDVTGSTALGERLDPESLRRVLARYFEVARDSVERHGGVVEKFIGDAVMAVFGVPQVHEDDALRAVRAAADLRTGLETLNEELERDYGTTLALRIGVNTGQVVTGTEERLATGDAVNVAARLEQAADAGEILVGSETLALLRNMVSVEALPPLALKGKTEPVAAARLISVESTAPAIRNAVRMVGRDRQLNLLRDAFDNVAGEHSCHLFTVLGTAGVGKSRLVSEFLGTLHDASVLRGRCLAYGEGITYWPVAEIVRQAGGTDVLDDDAARSALDAVLGDTKGAAGKPDEIAWAFRKLLEAKAATQPVVCLFDDIQWGEETFLDLVEHVADLSRGAPMLLLCMARPDLLDRRPTWAGGKLNATSVLLEPLSDAETDELIARLLEGSSLGAHLRSRIRSAAGGNPLFVEEMLALASRSSNGDEIAVPPTIQALLAARLDQLDGAERRVLERGSVEGEVFHRGAVAALVQDDAPLDNRLAALVRKDLLRPERLELTGEDGYRFRHLLIRDAAYEALPKATRADLHERFAAWLEERGSDLVELDEIVGYHMEQAFRYRKQLGALTDDDRDNAGRAAGLLARAGRRALDRSDRKAAWNLLERASQLLPQTDPRRVTALLELGRSLAESGEDVQRGRRLLEQAREDAEALGRDDLLIRTRLELALVEIYTEGQSHADAYESLTREAIGVLTQVQDEEGLARVWLVVATSWWARGHWDEMREPLSRSVEHARLAGNRSMEYETLNFVLAALAYGSTPASEGMRLSREVLENASRSRELQGSATRFLGWFTLLEGRLEEARELLEQARTIFTELGNKLLLAILAFSTGPLEIACGDAIAAEREYRAGLAGILQIGDRGRVTNLAAGLANALIDQGRIDDAEQYVDLAREAVIADDVSGQAVWRIAAARVVARRGSTDEAVELAEEATTMLADSEELMTLSPSLVHQAEVLELAGRKTEAVAALHEAIAAAERKGSLVDVSLAEARLAALDRD